MRKTLQLIGASQGWGAGHPQTAFGPKALLDSGFAIQWRCLLEPNIPYTPGKKLSNSERLYQIQDFSLRLANELALSQQDYFPVVLGGDHTIAIGTWSGLICAQKAQSEFGLIWIDAHMDAHTPQTSPSQNIHGMPLAVLLGKGESALVNLCARGAKLNPAHLVLIGVRKFESGEAALLKNLNVTIYFMEEVKARGFSAVFQDALAMVTHHTKGFGVSIDIDAFDPLLAPGTGAPEADGIRSIEEVCQALKNISEDPHFKALEIAEFDPTKDKAHQTQNLIKQLVRALG